MSDSERVQLRSAFDVFDADHDGVVSREELTGLMGSLIPNPKPEDVEANFFSMDENGDGSVTFEDFILAWAKSKLESPEVSRAENPRFMIPLRHLLS